MNCAAWSRLTAACTSLQWGGLADLIDQEGGEVGLGAGQVADELQQADGLGDPQRPAVVVGVGLEPLADLVDVGALLVGEVALDQLEHLVQRHQRADGLLGKRRALRDEHLVGLLDDRPVAAAVVPGRTGLEADARHDADAQVDVVRRVGVKLNEIGLVDVGAAGGPLQPQGGVQRPLIVGEQLLERRLGQRLLGQHPLGGDLPDVGGGEIDPVAEAVLELRQIDPLRVPEGRNHFVELLLRGDDDPAGSRDLAFLQQILADLAELLDGGPQVFDLVAAAGDVLAHLVDDEDEGLALAPPTPKLERPFDDLADGDGGVPVALGVCPRIRSRVRRRVEVVQDGAGTREFLRPLADHLAIPVLCSFLQAAMNWSSLPSASSSISSSAMSKSSA